MIDILLPSHAPQSYADRQTLWNAVEKVEGQWNAQLARGIIMALPRELPKSEYEPLIRDYCREQFVSKGMIADFAIHDKGDGNPHAHILLTMRAIGENGKWLPKAHKVYDLDENGERIRLPSGEWKSHKENTVDWNDRKYAEVWRTEWANTVNRYFEKNAIPERLDLRSFARQGKDELPTVHLGPAVAHMEQKGIATEIGNYNRQIKLHNDKLKKLKRVLLDLSSWLKSVMEKIAELTMKEAPPPTLLDFVNAYAAMQKSGRTEWSAKSKQTAAVNDVKLAAQVYAWMQTTGIYTLDDFHAAISAHKKDFDALSENKRAIRKLEKTLNYIDTIAALKPVYDKSKHGFEKARTRYAEEHKAELEQFNKAVRYLKANKLNATEREKYASERTSLLHECERLEQRMRASNLDPALLSQIKYRVEKVLAAGKLPQHTETIREQISQANTAKETGRRERRPRENTIE